MTGNQFVLAINKLGNPLKITGQRISGKVDLTTDIIASGVEIENCIFEHVVIFQKIDLNCGIIFNNCEFKKSFTLNECRATNHDIKFNFDNCHLEIKNTSIEGLYFNGSNEIDRGVRISEKSVINKLQVKTLISKLGSFSINESTINSQLDISQAKLSFDISIRGNSSIDAKLRFENNEVGAYVFTESNFNQDVHIWAGKVGNITFNDGSFKDDLSITGVPISSYLTIIGTDFQKSINFKLFDETNNVIGKLSKIYIKSGKFGEQFIVNGNNFEIEELVIETSKQLEGAIYFNSSNILMTKISGDNYNSNIVFNHCNFKELSFDFFYNYSTISIISAKSYGLESNLSIAHSNLGKTHLFNVFLDSFSKVNIQNSVLTEIIIANVKWFSDKNLNPEITSSQHTHEQRKEIYRQLKYALEKQGNRISSLHFKGLEMRTFKLESFSKVKWYKRILNIDRFVLWVGQSNDYGLNWFKPVLFAISFSILFHFLIVIGVSDELSYNPNWNAESIQITYNAYIEHINKLPQLMNPTHILSRVFPDKTELSFSVHFLDYLLKIILAFFIFQIISAFRKYIK